MGKLINMEEMVDRAMKSGGMFKIGSIWTWELYRKGALIDKWTNHNVVTNEGLEYIIDVCFGDGTAIEKWYICLWKSNTTPLATHTYAIPIYTELAYTDFTTGERILFEGSASGNTMTNVGNKAVFTIAEDKSFTVYGGALVGGGNAPSVCEDVDGGGILFCSSKLTGGSKPVSAEDELAVTVTITGSPEV